jgi:hypothetical protein
MVNQGIIEHQDNIQPETINNGLIHQKSLNEGSIRLKP